MFLSAFYIYQNIFSPRTMFLFATHLPNRIQKTPTRFDVSLLRKISQYFILFCPPSIYQNHASYNAGCVYLCGIETWVYGNETLWTDSSYHVIKRAGRIWLRFPSSSQDVRNRVSGFWMEFYFYLLKRADSSGMFAAFRVLSKMFDTQLWVGSFFFLLKGVQDLSMFSASWLCSKRSK